MTPARSKWLKIVLFAGLTAAAVYVPALLFGRGGVGHWSPDTFEAYSRRECLLPIVNLTVYRSRPSHWRYELVDELVEKGYWKPRATDAPRWLPMFRWNEQWHDGFHPLHREFSRAEPFWLEWTESHPAAAAELWPQTLEIIRTWPNGASWSAEFLISSRHADSADDVRAEYERLSRARKDLDGT